MWGYERDKQTQQIVRENEWHEAKVQLPGPLHDDPDPLKADYYLCVILRDRDRADLAYSPSRGGCLDK